MSLELKAFYFTKKIHWNFRFYDIKTLENNLFQRIK